MGAELAGFAFVFEVGPDGAVAPTLDNVRRLGAVGAYGGSRLACMRWAMRRDTT